MTASSYMTYMHILVLLLYLQINNMLLVLVLDPCTQCLFRVLCRHASWISNSGQIRAVCHSRLTALISLLLLIYRNGMSHLKICSWIRNSYSAHFSSCLSIFLNFSSIITNCTWADISCVHLFQADLLHLISLQYRLPFCCFLIKVALRDVDLHFSFILILLNVGK